MQVSVETTGNIGRKMTVEIPAERIDSEVDKRLKRMGGRVRLDGFRPGKVPFSIIKKRYGASVHQEVVGDVLEESFREAANQEELRVAGLPSIDLGSDLELGQPLSYIANFQVYPDITIADMSEMELVKPVAQVEEADIDRMIEVIRKQQKEWQQAERAAQDGDRVTIDFVGRLDGEVFDGGSADDFQFELGEGRMLPDFETAVLGMAIGEEKEADVSFPENYQADNLKGRMAQFSLSLKKVEEPVLPEINEEFIERFGVEEKTLDAFRAAVRGNMERELDGALRNLIKQNVMDGLLAVHEVETPAALVDGEIKQVRSEFFQNAQMEDSGQIPDNIFKSQAERRVKLGLIVGELIREKGLERDDARVTQMLESLAASYEEPEALIAYYRQTPDAMRTIEAAAMEEMVVDWVIERAKITEEQRDFEGVMNPPPNSAADADAEDAGEGGQDSVAQAI